MKIRLFLLTLFLPLVIPVHAAPYHVATSGDDSADGSSWATPFLTISNAVENAGNGDEILVTNGTYEITNQISITEGIELKSVNGPESTVIRRSSGTDRIIYMSNTAAVVSGFTITNGEEKTYGGGIYIDHFGTVTNCVIRGNKTTVNGYGGGLYLKGGGLVTDCRIIDNINVSRNGGGVYMTGGTVENCEISGNTCGGNGKGGGVGMTGGLLRNCLVYNNSHGGGDYTTDPASSYFPATGGVMCEGGGTVENCTI
ncbi:MAG: hypothetical protein EOM14_17130, partial [Clostridia bacterium]|nr:hypothetical protein [Clostridia bacterium]